MKKITDEDVFYGVESEGAGYFLTSYCTVKDIENPKLRAAAIKAKEALKKFEAMVKKIGEKLESEG